MPSKIFPDEYSTNPLTGIVAKSDLETMTHKYEVDTRLPTLNSKGNFKYFFSKVHRDELNALLAYAGDTGSINIHFAISPDGLRDCETGMQDIGRMLTVVILSTDQAHNSRDQVGDLVLIPGFKAYTEQFASSIQTYLETDNFEAVNSAEPRPAAGGNCCMGPG